MQRKKIPFVQFFNGLCAAISTKFDFLLYKNYKTLSGDTAISNNLTHLKYKTESEILAQRLDKKAHMLIFPIYVIFSED
jgi:hypothetical protein